MDLIKARERAWLLATQPPGPAHLLHMVNFVAIPIQDFFTCVPPHGFHLIYGGLRAMSSAAHDMELRHAAYQAVRLTSDELMLLVQCFTGSDGNSGLRVD